jgi:signal transduction histidine kinase
MIGFAMLSLFMYVAWSNLNKVDHMANVGDVVTDLFDTVLEVRRFEKNYFLYGTDENFNELKAYIDRLDAIMTEKRENLLQFSSEEVIDRIGRNLVAYRTLLEEGRGLGGARLAAWEKSLRSHGRLIIEDAEDVSSAERRVMQETLASVRKTIFTFIAVILCMTLVGATLFYRMLIRPLKELEAHMDRVAKGEFSPVMVKSRDREFISLNLAFNRMIHEIEERKAYLVESEKLASLGTLLFGVAHELNNPISNISTSAQILREEIAEGDAAFKLEMIDQIEEGVERAGRIVGSLLDYSRKGAREPVDIKAVVAETIRFLKGDLPTRVALTVDLPDGVRVRGEKQKLQQVFLNLIMNAVDAIKGEGAVKVTGRVSKAGGTFQVVVEDTGSGMDRDMVSKIFNPFFTTKGAKEGYGLGLFIVHNIIKEHDGSIIVNSEPGYGTSFLIELPMETK